MLNERLLVMQPPSIRNAIKLEHDFSVFFKIPCVFPTGKNSMSFTLFSLCCGYPADVYKKGEGNIKTCIPDSCKAITITLLN